MPTTVHLPKRLLERVDARADALGLSRNRLIIEALEEKLEAHASWAPELVQLLRSSVTSEVREASADMDREIARARRSRKAPPKL